MCGYVSFHGSVYISSCDVFQVKKSPEPLSSDNLMNMLSDPKYKDPAALGNMAGNILNSIDKSTPDMGKV